MKSFYALLLIVICLALMSGPVYAQNSIFPQILEFNTQGGGARAAGMGGAFLGVSEGEYAYAWNPAGMIFAKKPSIGLQFVSNNDKFSSDYMHYSGYLGMYDVQQAEAKRSDFYMNYSGFVVPFSFGEREWAVGGGFHNVQTLNLKFDAAGFFNSKDVFTQKEGIDAVTVGVSGKLINNLGIGIVANDYIRGGERNQFLGRSVVYQIPGNTTADTVDGWINSNSKYSGINFDIGLMGNFSMFKAGAVVHTPYDLKRNVIETDYLMIPPTPIGFIYRYTTTTNIPLSYSLGISVKPMEALIVAADFNSRPMSKSDIFVNYEMETISDYTYDPQWQDLNQFRIGLEYTVSAGFAGIPLRIGYRNNPSVMKKLTAINEVLSDSGLVPDLVYGGQESTNILTFGSGLRFQKAWFDFAYQFGSSSYNLNYNWAVPETETFKEKRDYSRLFFSAGMNF